MLSKWIHGFRAMIFSKGSSCPSATPCSWFQRSLNNKHNVLPRITEKPQAKASVKRVLLSFGSSLQFSQLHPALRVLLIFSPHGAVMVSRSSWAHALPNSHPGSELNHWTEVSNITLMRTNEVYVNVWNNCSSKETGSIPPTLKPVTTLRGRIHRVRSQRSVYNVM